MSQSPEKPKRKIGDPLRNTLLGLETDGVSRVIVDKLTQFHEIYTDTIAGIMSHGHQPSEREKAEIRSGILTILGLTKSMVQGENKPKEKKK